MSNNLNKNMSRDEMNKVKATATDADFTNLKEGEISTSDLPAENDAGILAKVKRKASRIGNITVKDIVKGLLIGGAVAGVGYASYRVGKKKGMQLAEDQEAVDADYSVSDSYDSSVYDAPDGADDSGD